MCYGTQCQCQSNFLRDAFMQPFCWNTFNEMCLYYMVAISLFFFFIFGGLVFCVFLYLKKSLIKLSSIDL